MKNKVISHKNTPTRFPHWNTFLCFLLLDHYNAPEWLCTVAVIFFALGWIALTARYFNEEKVDIFKEEKSNKSRLQQKIEKL